MGRLKETLLLRYWLGLILAVVATTLLAGTASAAERRVALVIGNSSYTAVPALTNTVNDANEMAAALRRVGFDVTEATDLTNADLRRTLQEFEERVAGSDIALVFYAGHGIEVNGVNYIVPIDAQLRRDTHVPDEAVPLTRVLTAVETARQLRLVLLDACRDNPFAVSMARSAGSRGVTRGLARVEPSGATLVSFAAKEGTTAADGSGRHSPYTEALLRNIETPGLEINFLFRRVHDEVVSATGGLQEPSLNGSLGSQLVYFKPPEPPQSGQPAAGGQDRPPPPQVGGGSNPAIDMASFYDRTERLNTLEAWDAFLNNCTSGPYCELAKAARRKLVEAQPPVVKPPEEQLVLVTPPPGQQGGGNNGGGGLSDNSGSGAECDRLAARQEDLDRPPNVTPVGDSDIQRNIDRTIAACLEAVRVAPNNRRYLYELGRAYDVADRSDDAAKWFGEAASRGNAAAQNHLGFMYQNGISVPQSNAEAVRLYRASADAGYALGMYNIGVMYRDGIGVAQDFATARNWFERAADGEGNGPIALAMTSLGFMYEKGNGVASDLNEARRWYERAANAGESQGMHNLAYFYDEGISVQQNYSEARRWYEAAARLGKADSMHNLGILYRDGKGVTRDPYAARDWFEKAIDGGNRDAIHNLAVMYEEGNGIPKDLGKAAELYVLALQRKNPWTMNQFKTNADAYAPQVRKAVQQFLIDRGYLSGSADGVIGPASRQAIDAWERNG